MDQQESIVTGIALQTELLKICSAHHQVFCDEDVDPAMAFAVAAELIRQDGLSARAFKRDLHHLANLLS